MRRDTEDRTGKKRIKESSRDALLYCVTKEDIREQVQALREIIQTGGNRDKIQAIRLIWDYAIAKPPQGVEFGSEGEGLDSIKIEIVRGSDETTEPATR